MKTKILLLLFFLGSSLLFAQEKVVNGTVKSAVDEMPVPGVNIIVKGTTRGTNTDFDGNYSIAVNKGDVIEFSYIGLKTQSVTVGDQSQIDISMQEDTESLDEVVVIGFGTQKRSEVTGAIASVDSEEILKQPFATATQALQGKLAGVNIVNTDTPGATPKVIVRGIGTAVGGEDVLYIVDGIQTTGINNINPADIESIDVLKDASSSAIYGMDAANGVVIVTTKKGKKGKTKIEFSSFYGAKSVLNLVEMADAEQYIRFYNENAATLPEADRFFLADASLQTYDTDWYDELLNVGFTNSNNVSLSGGGENSDFFFSYNNYNEEGILEGQDYRRNTLRMNNTFRFFENRLKVTSAVSAAFARATPKPDGAFNRAYRQSPIIPAFYPDGRFGAAFVNETTGIEGFVGGPGEVIGNLNNAGNPLVDVFFENQLNKTTDIQGVFEAELKVTDYLKVASRLGLTKNFGNFRNYGDIRGRFVLSGDPTLGDAEFQDFQDQFPENIQYADNSLNYRQTENFTYNWDSYVTFDKTFGDKHDLNVVLGITRGKRNDFFESEITGYGVPQLEQYWSIEFADTDNYDNISTQLFSTFETQLSYYGRALYNYDNKYFAQFNVRRDGISTFVENDEFFGTFPSFSLGWTITEEDFFNDIKGIDFLKLRGGWGQLGNSRVPRNEFRFDTSDGSNSVNYIFGQNQDLTFGAALGAQVFPISWEVTTETNIGLDFRFFDSRLAGSLDVYNRSTEAILNVLPVLNSPNEDRFFDNGADITNEGFEVNLSWRDNITQDLSYNIGVVYSYNNNTVENVVPAYDGQTGGSLNNGQITKRLAEGQPLYAWWMYEAEGVWQTQEEIDNNASIGGAQPGQLRYRDQNEDGIIDDRDKKYFDSYLPTYTVGVNLGLNYKNLDFSVDAFGAGGNKVYNGLKGTRINGGENIAADVFETRWTGPGSTNSDPGANRTAVASSYYLEDGDYLRINNMTLGYTFRNIVEEISLLRIYASAQNPFLFTDYSGFTPEILNSGNPEETAGIDLSAYPNTRTFLFGVNVQF